MFEVGSHFTQLPPDFKVFSLSREPAEQGDLPLSLYPAGLQCTFSRKVPPNAAEIGRATVHGAG